MTVSTLLLLPLRAGDEVGEADIRAAQWGWGGEVSPVRLSAEVIPCE